MGGGGLLTVSLIAKYLLDLGGEKKVPDSRPPFSSDSLSEKPSRAHTYTQATRLLSPSRIVILDGLNYIKGFRYQLWCAAREARVRVCTVYVATEGGRCREWNGVEGRGVDGEGKYREET